MTETEIAMRRLADVDAIEAIGDFAWAVIDPAGPGYRAIREGEEPTHLMVVTPSGDIHLPIGRAHQKDRNWGWDGNLDLPTVVPSIWVNKPSGWHGHVPAGALLTC